MDILINDPEWIWMPGGQAFGDEFPTCHFCLWAECWIHGAYSSWFAQMIGGYLARNPEWISLGGTPCIPTHRLQPTVLSDLRLVKMAREDGDMKADGHWTEHTILFFQPIPAIEANLGWVSSVHSRSIWLTTAFCEWLRLYFRLQLHPCIGNHRQIAIVPLPADFIDISGKFWTEMVGTIYIYIVQHYMGWSSHLTSYHKIWGNSQ